MELQQVILLLMESNTNNDFLASLAKVKEYTNKICDKNLEDASNKLSSLEMAKLDVCLAYTCCSLLFIAANLNGEPNTNILQELDRVKDYISRIKEAEEENKPSKKRRLLVDKAAAARLIQFELLGQPATTNPEIVANKSIWSIISFVSIILKVSDNK